MTEYSQNVTWERLTGNNLTRSGEKNTHAVISKYQVRKIDKVISERHVEVEKKGEIIKRDGEKEGILEQPMGKIYME